MTASRLLALVCVALLATGPVPVLAIGAAVVAMILVALAMDGPRGRAVEVSGRDVVVVMRAGEAAARGDDNTNAPVRGMETSR